MVTGALLLRGRGSGTFCRLNCKVVTLLDNSSGAIRIVGLRRFVTLCKIAPYRNSFTYLLSFRSRVIVHFCSTMCVSFFYSTFNGVGMDTDRCKFTHRPNYWICPSKICNYENLVYHSVQLTENAFSYCGYYMKCMIGQVLENVCFHIQTMTNVINHINQKRFFTGKQKFWLYVEF